MHGARDSLPSLHGLTTESRYLTIADTATLVKKTSVKYVECIIAHLAVTQNIVNKSAFQ